MKPFKPLTLKEQRELYPRVLKRTFLATRRRIYEKHEERLDLANSLEHKNLVKLNQKIENVEDAVADHADKYYGGWDVWRRNNKKMLARVVSEMREASADLIAKRIALEARIKELRRPYLEEIEELETLHDKLLDEVA